MELRLQKYLATAGVASRRKAEEMILAGDITVNGQVVNTLGAKVDPKTDKVLVKGKTIKPASDKIYIMLHKPPGVVTTVTDTHNRPTVMNFVPKGTRLYPVGRLDADTSGLLILTNDGDFALKLTHPSYKVDKTYEAEVRGIPSPSALRSFRSGLLIEGKRTAPAKIKVLEQVMIKPDRRQKTLRHNTKVLVTIHEGRNRQVRKMCEAIGHKVVTLKRLSVGELALGSLKQGAWRNLTKNEIKKLLPVQ